MAHENEIDDEIEQHLLQKITHALEHPSEHNNLVTKNFISFESEFEELKKKLEDTTNTVHGDEWLSVRRDNLYHLNDLLTEWNMVKKHNSFSLVEDREACLNIRKSLKMINKVLTTNTREDSSSRGKSSRGDHDKSLSHHQEPIHPIFKRNKEEVYRWSSRHGPWKVHGFEHIVMAMERELVMRNNDAPFKVFGVAGGAGIGKTTLCQTIFGRKLVKEHFSPRIWVCLSKQPREDDPKQAGNDDVKKPKDDDMKQPNDPKQRKEIVVRILEGLGIEDKIISDAGNDSDGNGLRRLILLLRLQLTGKRYLIVLDDAWNHNEFFLKLTEKEQMDENWGEELAYALPKGFGGSVISSSRSDALLKKMLGKDVGVQYLEACVNKDYVNKEDANKEKEIIYEIYKDTVIGYDENKREFPEPSEELKMEILRKCDGNPLAAKLLAIIDREKPLAIQEQKPVKSASKGQEITTELRGGGANAGSDGGSGGGGGVGVQEGKQKGDLLPN